MNERLVAIGGHRLYVREAGDGPAVVFGHSLAFDGDMWRAQQDTLAGRFRTIAFDHRGHGQSDPVAGPFDLWDMADDVVRLLDALGIERTAYCGLSLGGMVGMRLALRHPDRVWALALMNTSAEPEAADRREMFAQMNELSRGAAANDATAAFLLGLMFSPHFLAANPAARDWAQHKLAVPNDDGLYWVGRAVIERDHVLDRLQALAVPTLVIGGDADQAVAPVHAARIAAAIPNARLETLVDCGHMSAVERPQAVSDLLGTFFTAHAGGADA